MQTPFDKYFVVKYIEELEYIGAEYKIWNDDFIKGSAKVDTSHFRQFPEFLSCALHWRLILEKMYPSVEQNLLRSYGYYCKKALMYAEDRYIKHLIEDYIVVLTSVDIPLDVQLFWPEVAYRQGYKDAYRRLPVYNSK